MGKYFQAIHAIHPDVEHRYRHVMSAGVGKKIFRPFERANLESYRYQQVINRFADRKVVIHYRDLILFQLAWTAHIAVFACVSPSTADRGITIRALRLVEAFA